MKIYIALLLFALSNLIYAAPSITKRIPELENEKVSVWETIIYPGKSQTLKTHRHERDRVLVALTSGVLKVVYDNGKTNDLKLVKDHAYYLPKDTVGELHTDENISNQPIKVLVVELRE